jgi:hypothetical protein
VAGGHHDRDERADALARGEIGELRQHARGDPVRLPVVGDGERDLGLARRLAHEHPVHDDPARGAGDGDERDRVVRGHGHLGGVGQVGAGAEEAQPARLLGTGPRGTP